jgi:hypothetical protein
VNPAEVPAWLQAGGLLAFAAAVWMEQRAMRKAVEQQGQNISAILEHVRDVRTKRVPTAPIE